MSMKLLGPCSVSNYLSERKVIVANQQFGRHQRVSDQLQRELAHLIQFEIKDPRLGLVTLSGVKVSRDLGVANVYVTVMPGGQTQQSEAQKTDQDELSKQAERSLKVLEKSAGFLRKMLAQSMQLRTIPQLKFHYDESIERGQTLSSLIDKARASDHQLAGETSPAKPE